MQCSLFAISLASKMNAIHVGITIHVVGDANVAMELLVVLFILSPLIQLAQWLL